MRDLLLAVGERSHCAGGEKAAEGERGGGHFLHAHQEARGQEVKRVFRTRIGRGPGLRAVHDLHRDGATDATVVAEENLPHAALTERGLELVPAVAVESQPWIVHEIHGGGKRSLALELCTDWTAKK